MHRQGDLSILVCMASMLAHLLPESLSACVPPSQLLQHAVHVSSSSINTPTRGLAPPLEHLAYQVRSDPVNRPKSCSVRSLSRLSLQSYPPASCQGTPTCMRASSCCGSADDHTLRSLHAKLMHMFILLLLAIQAEHAQASHVLVTWVCMLRGATPRRFLSKTAACVQPTFAQ